MKYLVDYLKECNQDLLLDIVTDRHLECSFEHENLERARTREGYQVALERLLSFGTWTWFRKKYTVWFQEMKELGDDDEMYIDVCLRSKEYEAPADGLKYWGGKCEDKDDSPEGHYNCNWDGYNERFSISMPWRIVVNLEVDFDKSVDSYELEKLMAEFLWEITFDGYTENGYQEMRKNLTKITEDIESGKEKMIPFDEAMKDIKDFAEIRDGGDEITTDTGVKVQFTATALEDIKEIIVDDLRHNGGEGNDCELD